MVEVTLLSIMFYVGLIIFVMVFVKIISGKQRQEVKKLEEKIKDLEEKIDNKR
ncbi:hypothetical protein [Brevibacillus sp. H7]|uniref:hypothetical protein n=1 Tax=Brevibacillus sp. H7 TaxID=3349138 RepID=UPI00380DAF99